jgi:hypothetical protein
MLGVTTIGAIDENKAARTKRRRAADRQRKENARRAKGVKPRKVYEGQSVSARPSHGNRRHQPRTWYRRPMQPLAQVRLQHKVIYCCRCTCATGCVARHHVHGRLMSLMTDTPLSPQPHCRATCISTSRKASR